LFPARLVADDEDVKKGGRNREAEGDEASHPVEEKRNSVQSWSKHSLAGEGEQEGDGQEHHTDQSTAPGRVGWHGRNLAESGRAAQGESGNRDLRGGRSLVKS
jgi:hypothetical protein